MGMGFVGVTVFGIMVVGMGVGMGMRMGVRVTVRMGRRANWDRYNGLVGYAAAFAFSEYSQPPQNASD